MLMTKNQLDFVWYLASPYINVDDPSDKSLPLVRSKAVSLAAARLALADVKLYCPILVSEELKFWRPELRTKGAEWWVESFDHAFMKRCDGLIVYKLKGWDISDGVDFEIKHFTKRKTPICYLPETFSIHEACAALNYVREHDPEDFI